MTQSLTAGKRAPNSSADVKGAGIRVLPRPVSASQGSEPDEALIAAASEVAPNAYAPYSHFTVGAALRTSKGAVFVGCNVENVSYPVGVCAERNAIAAAVASEGPSMQIEAIAIVARNRGAAAACSPCGACRQAIGEFGTAARVHYRGGDHAFRCESIGTLLPGAFSFAGPDEK